MAATFHSTKIAPAVAPLTEKSKSCISISPASPAFPTLSITLGLLIQIMLETKGSSHVTTELPTYFASEKYGPDATNWGYSSPTIFDPTGMTTVLVRI
jgi:hypothetical protein